MSLDELMRGLTVDRFSKSDELKHTFKQVDLDGSNELDFSEVSGAPLE